MNAKIEDLRKRYLFISDKKMPYIIFGVFFLLAFIFINPTINGFILNSYRIFIITFIFALAALGIYMYLNDKLDTGFAVFLLIMIGMLIRLVYVLSTPWFIRQHDLGDVVGTGHMGYISHIANNFSLPDSNDLQFSHPPLHHIILGLFLSINNFFKMTQERIIEGMQLITAFYSCCIMVISYRIFKLMKLTGVFLVIAMAVICLHPTFIIIGGSINNDMLMILFSFATILWLMKWNEDPNFYNICFLALCLGLAMMSKVSASILAFVIAPVFLVKMFSYKKPFKQWTLFCKFITFAAISIPIGMWHPIRNLVRFGQKLGYVYPLDVNSTLFCGDSSIMERFLSIPISQLIINIYGRPFDDFNLPIYTLKSSIFGEYGFNGDVASLAVVLTIFNALMIIFSLLAMVYVMFYDKRPQLKISKWILLFLWITQIGAFVYLNIQYPFGCSMDFRYIVLTLLCGAGFISIACQHVSLEKPNLWQHLKRPVYVVVGGFCIFSSLFYLFI